MIKKLISLLLCVIFCTIGINATAFCADTSSVSIIFKTDSPTMTVNGQPKPIDADSSTNTSPVIINGRTLLPIRAVIEEMGGSISWDGNEKRTVLSYGDNVVELAINSNTALLNNVEYTLDCAPLIINSRTFFPIRFIAESFGFSVSWNNATKETTISYTANTDSENTIQSNAVVDDEVSETPDNTSDTNSHKVLVVYYSRTGTTKAAAESIAEITQSNIAEIIPITPYPDNYNDCIVQAEREIKEDFRPEIKLSADDISAYDTIILGYPIWYNTTPPPVASFLANNDFSNKTIIPFCTSGGSSINGSIRKINALCPDTTVSEGLNANNYAKDRLEQWLHKLGVIN